MKTVMATGVFDIIHLGHIFFLKESKKLGDVLVVVVARDSTARKNGKTPVMDETTRVAIVNELKPVDRAVLGHEGDIFRIVQEIKPDIITLGYDQNFDADAIRRGAMNVGVHTEVVRLPMYNSEIKFSSTEIKRKISGSGGGSN
ncbi:MAG: FAD synthase [Candidatus Thermoplasmatota archaeon]|nr:FAD synthase [Candidatus Thermoplasmatota archaeon]